MFKPLSSKLNVTLLEDDILRFWTLHRIFQRSNQQPQDAPEFIFYEEPPSASGHPGLDHAQTRAFKDVFPRYKRMRGYHVVRRSGWNTHGLPVELGVENKLGITSKRQIEAYGIDRFNEQCRQSAFEYIQEWQKLFDRLGFWVDLDDAYVTYTNDYIESVWWALKALWDKGLLYQGNNVVPYCPRCGTPLSDHEVVSGNREVTDASVYVRLPLVDEPGTALLVWAATPWTLTGNVAVAAHPDIEYVTIVRTLSEGGRERLILARSLLENVFGDESVRVADAYPGKKLKGRHYRPLFTFMAPDKPAYLVVLQDHVSTQDGTGLAQLAPFFSAQDMQAARDHNLPSMTPVAEDGTFISEVRPWSGRFVKEAEPYIIEDLQARGLLFKTKPYTHTASFCQYCYTPLLDYTRSAWYLRASQYKDRMAALIHQINWLPEPLQKGAFGYRLEHNADWILGRQRFWGTPMPVWECQSCHYQIVVGSVAELSKLAGYDCSDLDLHRPAIDQVQFSCPQCDTKDIKGKKKGAKKGIKNASNGVMRRVHEVMDKEFDAGAMPTAQWHFPFDNRETFRKLYPADFICEAIDQTGGWLYSLHAISTMLMDNVAFKNVICPGTALDSGDQRMSQLHASGTNPWDIFNAHGADASRWYLYTASPAEGEQGFSIDQVGKVVSSFTQTLWNVFSFFVNNANLDGWNPMHSKNQEGILGAPHFLDRWLRSELHTLVGQVTGALEHYDITGATRPIQAFVDDLSGWYLRHSRRRFWKGADAADKYAAYATLYEALVTLSKLIAPTMPFMSEALYQNLVRSIDSQAPISVHLNDWPQVDASLIEPSLRNDMRLVRKMAALGHSARSQVSIKLTQPLSEAALTVSQVEEIYTLQQQTSLLADELNVKQVHVLSSAGEVASADIHPGQAVAVEGAYMAALKTELTPALVREGLANELIRHVLDLRKQAELDLTDRIHLYLVATPGLLEVISEYTDDILGETLTVMIENAEPPADFANTQVWFEGEWVKIGVAKV